MRAWEQLAGFFFAGQCCVQCNRHIHMQLDRGACQTVANFCVSAHPSCYQAGSNCLAYIGTNVVDLSYLVPYYPIIWLSVTWEDSGWNDQCRGDCNDIKHKIASFPRILASMFPDTLDKDQVWLVGFSAGVGGINRGTVDSSKGYDRSRYGSTSDLFAGTIKFAPCFCFIILSHGLLF